MPTVNFGNEPLSFDLEPGDSLTEREPADQDRGWNRQRFFQALSAAHFDRFLSHGRPLVVVNDAFRPTPTGQVLSLIKEFYPDFESDFIVACGNHPVPPQEDLPEIFGTFRRADDARLYFHDSHNREEMVQVGELHGHPLYLNRKVFEYPAIIVIGSVEPHYFAGFTGGRKSVVPGLSDVETNRRNHALAVSLEARPLRLKGNPVAKNLGRLLALIDLPTLFSIQIVPGRGKRILDCFCGGLKSSFAEAVDLSEQVYSFSVDQQFDLVVAEMLGPLDRNLYQIQKGIENCAAAVRDGGTILVVSACREGIGNDEFYQLARQLKNEEMVLSHAEMENPPMGIHKLSRIIHLSKRINVRALTLLKHEILEQVYIEPAVSLEAEMMKMRHTGKKDIDILLVRDAGLLAVKAD